MSYSIPQPRTQWLRVEFFAQLPPGAELNEIDPLVASKVLNELLGTDYVAGLTIMASDGIGVRVTVPNLPPPEGEKP